MSDIHATFGEELREPEARHEYAEEFLNAFIALQVKTLRQQRGWSQEDLAERAGMKQSRISAMEQVDYASWSVRTLRRLAQAFDLALIVRFESFGKFLDEVTAVSRPALEKPSFDADPAFQGKETIKESAGDSITTASIHVTPLPPRFSRLRIASRG
jgi:transcriptional regulator with XRE-family HTH domain